MYSLKEKGAEIINDKILPSIGQIKSSDYLAFIVTEYYRNFKNGLKQVIKYYY